MEDYCENYENEDNIFFQNNGTFDMDEYDTFDEFYNEIDEENENYEEIYLIDNTKEILTETLKSKQLNEIQNKKINSISKSSFNGKIMNKLKEYLKIVIKKHEKRKEKISIYLNSSERKKRKIMRELKKKKEKMNLILSKKKIQNKIYEKKQINNKQLYQNQFFFTPIFHNIIPIFDKKIINEKFSYIGKKRLNF